MKGLSLAVCLIIVVLGFFAFMLRNNPDRKHIQDALGVLREPLTGVPGESDSIGFIKVNESQLNQRFSIDAGLSALEHSDLQTVKGTLIYQQYLRAQLEYKLAELKEIGGDITSKELLERRSNYVDATSKLQAYIDSQLKWK